MNQLDPIPAQRGPSSSEHHAYRPMYQPLPGQWGGPGELTSIVQPGPPRVYRFDLPPPPRRSRLWSVLTGLIVLSTVIALAGGAAAATGLRVAPDGQTSAAWVDALRPESRDPALSALLTRRANAIMAADRAAFLADVEPADPAFVARQTTLFDNLVKLRLAQLEYRLEPQRQYAGMIQPAVRERHKGLVRAFGVTVRYRVNGVDSRPVTTPWVPMFGYVNGAWKFVGEAADKNLPYGTNGQAWDAGPIVVSRGPRVVVVLSADDAGRGPYLVDLAEKGLTRVAAVRPAGWDGKVLVTAVQDQKLFDTYFADSPERVQQVAAIAVPYYDRVPDWEQRPEYAATRIVFNPQELSANPDELQHDLVHEFAHAAMGPVTTSYTPRWLVEGFAEYVAYKNRIVRPDALRRVLADLRVDSGLPTDENFYKEPYNYVGAWLACKMIAERHGEAKLVSLYESYRTRAAVDTALPSILGIDRTALDAQWRDYVQKQKR